MSSKSTKMGRPPKHRRERKGKMVGIRLTPHFEALLRAQLGEGESMTGGAERLLCELLSERAPEDARYFTAIEARREGCKIARRLEGIPDEAIVRARTLLQVSEVVRGEIWAIEWRDERTWRRIEGAYHIDDLPISADE